jgi:hypothetical protein
MRVAGGLASSHIGQVLLDDRFLEDVPAGHVVGSSVDGKLRRGVDAERTIAIDNGALRIGWLRDPGWRRAAIAYGPFDPTPGLTFTVSLLAGLTTSQTDTRPEGRREVVLRALRTLPRAQLRKRHIVDSLAVGLFSQAVPRRPLDDGTSLVLRAHESAIGELRVTAEGVAKRIVLGLQNVPLVLTGVVRDEDVVLYGGSLRGAFGFPEYPGMRPLAVLPLPVSAGPVFLGVHQSVLGEVKYRVDTRVYRCLVEQRDAVSRHYGAMAAGVVPRAADGTWSDATGARWSGEESADGSRVARADLPAPVGLMRTTFGVREEGAVRLVWRADASNGTGWALTLRPEGTELGALGDLALVTTDSIRLTPRKRHVVEVLDDGATMSAYLDQRLLFDRWINDARNSDGTGVSLETSGQLVHPVEFELHPRSVAISDRLRLDPPWPAPPQPSKIDPVSFSLAGRVGHDLSSEQPTWQRVMGSGVIECAGGDRARVRASIDKPIPGRTVYAVPWATPDYADVAVTITPPGTARGQRHQGRCGLAFWQDNDNHFVVNNFIDDTSVGVSVSAFLRVDGLERQAEWDATWSNVGTRIDYGVPYELVDGELVLYRAISDYRATFDKLVIRRVGLVANWEWGDDTGTVFRDFVARQAA